MKYTTQISLDTKPKNMFAFLGTYEEVTSVKIESKIIMVTPELAKAWLKNNFPDNRHLNLSRVNKYATAMINNEWEIGDDLRFDIEETLVNGQHRLHAVVKANKPVPFRVSVGFPRKSIHTFDRGSTRTLANVCQLNGLNWVRNDHISTFNNLFYCLPDSHKTPSYFTDGEKMKALSTIQDCFDVVFFKKGQSRGIKCASIFAVITRAFYSSKVKEKELLKDFLLLLYGCNYSEHEPMFYQTSRSSHLIVKLREKMLLKDWSKGLEGIGLANEKSYYIQKTLESFLLNKKTKINSRLSLSVDNLFPVSWIDDLTFNRPN